MMHDLKSRLFIPLLGILFPLPAPLHGQVPLLDGGFTGQVLAGDRLLSPEGLEHWRLRADGSRGAKVIVTRDGGLAMGDQTFDEISAALLPDGRVTTGDYVVEADFTLTRQDALGGNILFISPRISKLVSAIKPKSPDGAVSEGYRIVYRFSSPGRFANNNTGFFLVNTADPEDRRSLSGKILAGRVLRLEEGVPYHSLTTIRNLDKGTEIGFYLASPRTPDGLKQPLILYVDTSSNALRQVGEALVQVGGGALSMPGSPVVFRGVKIHPWSNLALLQKADSRKPPVAFSSFPPPNARTELPNVFSDKMVLQQKKPVRVWGQGIEGDTITVTIGTNSATAPVTNGKWLVVLPPMEAGGPLTLRVVGKDRTLEVKDVLIGEVWVLGGQSNMGWYLSDTTGAAEEVAGSDYPAIRFFAGWHPAAAKPQWNLAGGTWKSIQPGLKGAYSAVGHYFAKELHLARKVPVGLLIPSVPATAVECWLDPEVLAKVYRPHLEAGDTVPNEYGDPACYFFGKVSPLMPFSMSGIIWYQGEGSEATRGLRNRTFLPALKDSWREGFREPDATFLVVQLPNYKKTSPEIREAQVLCTMGDPRSAVVVTADVGENEEIHPRDKKPVGERLALAARTVCYGEKIQGLSPIFSSISFSNRLAVIRFLHSGQGMSLRGEGGFEICGMDQRWVPAKATVMAPETLLLEAPDVLVPKGARYGWSPTPVLTLYGKNGLPASPFQTTTTP